MSFVAAAALAVAGLIAVPILAHLLRRGQTREQEFPPAALVPATPATLRQRSRLEDRMLLAIRAAMVACLAVLGATPLVQCERLSLAREAGASVALALVVDDSLSMRAQLSDGESRWEKALGGARELLRSARDGDAVAIVLAGAPARVALAATTDLGTARDTLQRLEASDRSTALSDAVVLARSALEPLAHVDKRLVVLSDLADQELPAGEPEPWLPLPELATPVANCGIARGDRQGRRVQAVVACTSPKAARGRSMEVVAAGEAADGGKEKVGQVARVELKQRQGTQALVVDVGPDPARLEVRLTGQDALEHDDTAPVAPQAARLSVGVVVDRAGGSATTGGATLLEQALDSLDAGAVVRPLAVIPDDAKDFEGIAAIILDDPPGLPPESRAAVSEFVETGGVAMALLGPRAAQAQLASTLEPFARGGAHWEEASGLGVDPASLGWLGAEAGSLGELTVGGRMRLDGAEPKAARVIGRWEDGAAWLLERSLGRGLIVTVGLPVSVDQSDFALRPGFVALLDHAIRQARQRTGPRQTPAGAPWSFAGAEHVTIEGPVGPVRVSTSSSIDCTDPALASERDCEGAETLTAVPTIRGTYQVRVDGRPQVRVATLEPDEIFRPPRPLQGREETAVSTSSASEVDASREVALIVLALFAAEIALRLLGGRRARPAASPG